MHGGLGPYITRRGHKSVGIDPDSVDWTDIDERLVVGLTARHTTQQITGISQPVTLHLHRRYGPSQTEEPLEGPASLYYRVDATEPTIPADFDPVEDGWSTFPENQPCTLVVENGDWVTFGVAESPWTVPVDHVVVVKNGAQNLATLDDFGVRRYVEIAGPGSSSSSSAPSSSTSSAQSSTSSAQSSTSSAQSSATSSTTSSTSSGTSGGSGGGGGGQAPPPEDP